MAGPPPPTRLRAAPVAEAPLTAVPHAPEVVAARGADWRVHAVLFGVQLAFATLSVAGRVIVRELDPLALALLRLAGAGAVFAALAGPALWRPTWRERQEIAFWAFFGIYANQLLFLTGLRYTTATRATLLVATIPVFTAAFAVLSGREQPRPTVFAGIGLAFCGVASLLLGKLDGGTAWGDLLVLLNSLLYAVYLIGVRGPIARHGAMVTVAWGFAFGAVAALPVGGPGLWAAAGEVSGRTWALVAWVVSASTVGTYLGNAWALKRAPASLVATYIYVQPVVATALAAALLGETVGISMLFAGAAVLGGVSLVNRRR